ncbi:hypothetical protein [Mycoplasmopsis pullorum]|uniref:hypothetical protein n=1 Tax=Mycoplasmopsis pullorum TaxID=48003 RepID=UPI0011188F38|nr:hypothetical protein [Mycoplasmopsis pullorum]TNK86456.1 hypothetical protein C4M82_03445 [Mycoplasmopsis pullorum]
MEKIHNKDDTFFFTEFDKDKNWDDKKWSVSLIFRRNFVTKRFELLIRLNDINSWSHFNYILKINDKLTINFNNLNLDNKIYHVPESEIDLNWSKLHKIDFITKFVHGNSIFTETNISFDHVSKTENIEINPNLGIAKLAIPYEYVFNITQKGITREKNSVVFNFQVDRSFKQMNNWGVISADLEIFPTNQKYYDKKIFYTFPAIENAKLIFIDTKSTKKDEIPIKFQNIYPTEELYFTPGKYLLNKMLKTTPETDFFKGNFFNVSAQSLERISNEPLHIICEFSVLDTIYRIKFLSNKLEPIDHIKHQLRVQELDGLNWNPEELHMIQNMTWLELINTKFRNIDDFINFVMSKKDDEDEDLNDLKEDE